MMRSSFGSTQYLTNSCFCVSHLQLCSLLRCYGEYRLSCSAQARDGGTQPRRCSHADCSFVSFPSSLFLHLLLCLIVMVLRWFILSGMHSRDRLHLYVNFVRFVLSSQVHIIDCGNVLDKATLHGTLADRLFCILLCRYWS